MLGEKSIRVTLTDLYMGVICIFPITTALENNGIINKLLFGILTGLYVCMMICKPIKNRTIVWLFVLVVNYMFAIINTSFPLDNSNLLFYFPFYLLYTYYMCDNMETVINWFSKHKTFVYFVVVLWSLLVGISIFIPECYNAKEGGSLYFGSFCKTIFRLGPSAVFIQVLVILMQVLYGEKRAIAYNLIPMYCYLMGSSRTYLVVGLCLFLISWYIICKRKIVFWITVIPLMLVVLLLVAVSAMGDKIAYTLNPNQYGDFWFRITSSRSLLWEIDLTEWSRMPLFNKLFGSSLNFTFDVSGVWSHNDFIETLCGFGAVGLLQYVYSVARLYRDSIGSFRIPFTIKACVFFAWFFNAFFNMHYVYFCAMLCYPLLVFALRCYYLENHKAVNRD